MRSQLEARCGRPGRRPAGSRRRSAPPAATARAHAPARARTPAWRLARHRATAGRPVSSTPSRVWAATACVSVGAATSDQAVVRRSLRHGRLRAAPACSSGRRIGVAWPRRPPAWPVVAGRRPPAGRRSARAMFRFRSSSRTAGVTTAPAGTTTRCMPSEPSGDRRQRHDAVADRNSTAGIGSRLAAGRGSPRLARRLAAVGRGGRRAVGHCCSRRSTSRTIPSMSSCRSAISPESLSRSSAPASRRSSAVRGRRARRW